MGPRIEAYICVSGKWDKGMDNNTLKRNTEEIKGKTN